MVSSSEPRRKGGAGLAAQNAPATQRAELERQAPTLAPRFARAGGFGAAPRVLHVAETIKGGVGTYIAELVSEQIDQLGMSQIRVLVPEEHRRQVQSLPENLVTTFRRKGRSLPSLMVLARRTLEEVEAFQPDIIHAHSTFAGFVVRLLLGWKSRRPRIVYCPHGWAFDRPGSSLINTAYRQCERSLAHLCDSVVAISTHDAELAAQIGIGPEHCRLVLNGIAARSPGADPSSWADDRLKVLFVGRLDLAKGLDVLLDAVRGLEDKIVIRVAGEQVVNEGRPLADASNVTYLGWLSAAEIEGALATADVVTVPSRNEGFGLVALEAMRAGRMVVASAVGGLPEIVVDGVTGRLVPPQDPAALRDALLRDDARARSAMGERGRERFRSRFTAARMSEDILDLYSDLVREPAASAAHAPHLASAAR